MKLTVNVPIVAYTGVSLELEVPDDFDQTTGKSESQPDFSLVELTLNSADIALEKVYGESPEWYVNEIALEDFTNGVYPISDLIEKD